MGTTIMLIGIGLMVQNVVANLGLIGFIVFAVGAVMALFRI